MKASLYFSLITFILFSMPFTFAKANGPKAPKFTLTGHDQKKHSLADYNGKFVVLEWYNKDCPFVRKFYNSKKMQDLQNQYTKQGVVWLSIISSAPGKQGYLEPFQASANYKNSGLHSTAILIDKDGKVGRMYDAKTTPNMVIINKSGNIVYEGAIDSIRSTDPGDISKAKNYVSLTLDQLLANKKVQYKKTQSYGCSVKY